MTDVSDWARERAYTVGRFGNASDPELAFYVAGFIQGASDLADLLLSDEACDAAATRLETSIGRARAALQAALTAITNPETPISSTTEQTGA